MAKSLSPNRFPLIIVGLCLAGFTGWAFINRGGNQPVPIEEESFGAVPKFGEIPFDGPRALDDLTKLCELGPRPSGSEAMRKQQDLLEKHFADLGAKVVRQTFRVRHPVDGSPVEMVNLIIQWRPEA